MPLRTAEPSPVAVDDPADGTGTLATVEIALLGGATVLGLAGATGLYLTRDARRTSG